MKTPTALHNAIAPASGLAELSGLELVVGLANGSIRPPSMTEILPFTRLPPEEGRVELQATPETCFCNLTNTFVDRHGILNADSDAD